MTLGLSGHQWQEGPDPVDDAPQVYSEYPLPAGDRAEPGIGVTFDARVVAHDMDGTETIKGSGRQCLHRRFVAHVGGYGERLDAKAGDLLLSGLQGIMLDIGQHNVEPRPGEALGQRKADAARSSGDDGNLPRCQVHARSSVIFGTTQQTLRAIASNLRRA